MSVEMKNAIQMGHLCSLAALAASIPPGNTDVHVIGYIIGRVTGVSYRSNPNGDEPSMGLTGMFEATPTEAGRAVIRAPMVFTPTSFTKMVAAQITPPDAKAPKAAPPKGKSIELEGIAELPLAIEIGIRKNNGAGVGYEFAVTMLTPDDKAKDALAEVRSFLPAQIAQRSPAPALPAPTGKGKTKPKKK